MTAASREALEDLARRSCGVMPSCRATQGRSPGPTWSTFRQPLRGGASWVWGAPDGAIYLLRASPKRVVLGIQSWANTTPDAQWGPNTHRAILGRLGLPLTTPMSRELLERILGAVYHPEGGTVVLPQSVELPAPDEVPVWRVTGDASYYEAVRLSDGSVSAPDARTGTLRQTGTTSVAQDLQQIARTAETAARAPATPAPPPAASATPTGVRITGSVPAGVRVYAKPEGVPGATAVQLTGSPLSAITGAGQQRVGAENGPIATTVVVNVALGTVVDIPWSSIAAGQRTEKCALACEQGRRDEAARMAGCTCDAATTPAEPPPKAESVDYGSGQGGSLWPWALGALALGGVAYFVGKGSK